MSFLRMTIIATLGLSACKAGGQWNWSAGGSSGSSSGSSPGGSSSSPSSSSTSSGSPSSDVPEISADEKQQRKKERDQILENKSIPQALAFYKKYLTKDIKNACGIDVTLTADLESLKNETQIVQLVDPEDQWCGALAQMVVDLCKDDVGKAAVKDLKALHCEKKVGKARTKPTTHLFGEFDRSAYDWDQGKLTVKLGNVFDHGYPEALIKKMWPQVSWHRETQPQVEGWQNAYTRWSEDKDGVDFQLDVIDMAGFGKAAAEGSGKWMYAEYICRKDDGKLGDFLDHLWKHTEKGKQILRGIKKITCSVTTNPDGKVAEIKGDRLIFYARVLQKHHDASFFLDRPEKLPINDATHAYGLFRKKHKLGGECPWKTNVVGRDKDPDAKVCDN